MNASKWIREIKKVKVKKRYKGINRLLILNALLWVAEEFLIKYDKQNNSIKNSVSIILLLPIFTNIEKGKINIKINNEFLKYFREYKKNEIENIIKIKRDI